MNRLFRMAVIAGVENSVRLHIDRGDDVNSVDDKGLTPLMVAALRNKASICRLLIDARADISLLDPLGRNALSIAQGAGATEAAEVLARALPAPESTEPSAIETSTSPESLSDVSFDLSPWESEEETIEPEADETLTQPAVVLQEAITLHAPIDGAPGWEEFDISLPSFATAPQRIDSVGHRDDLRLLLLRAMREGSVPEGQLPEFAADQMTRSDGGGESLLHGVVRALGAAVDERFEYRTNHEDWTVFVDPAASLEEEDLLTEAFYVIDNSAREEDALLRMFQREAQRHPLVSASEEIILSQTMETELDHALDALAAWPEGIDALLAAAHLVASGAKPLSWIAAATFDDAPGDEASLGAELAMERHAAAVQHEESGEDSEEDSNEVWPPVANHDLESRVHILASMTRAQSIRGEHWSEQRHLLGSIAFRRSFLVDLADFAKPAHPSAMAYGMAIGKFRRARDRLVLANLRLVIMIARKHQYSGLPLDDLIQDGNLGLLKAVDKFDWRKGFRFATYATWWIRQAITRAVADTSRCIRVPVHIHDAAYHAERAARAWRKERGREPTAEELSTVLSLPLRKVQALLRAGVEPESLDELMSGEFIPPDVVAEFMLPDPSDAMDTKELSSQIEKALSSLKPTETLVIKQRFGFGGDEGRTLDEIGKVMGVTRERIRQIESKTLRRLKHPANSGALVAWASPPEKVTIVARKGSADDDEILVNEMNQVVNPAVSAPSQVPQIAPLGPPPRPGPPKALDRLLAEAAALGIPVDDRRGGPDGALWVIIHAPTNTKTRTLIRKLHDMGFKYSQGEGFWR